MNTITKNIQDVIEVSDIEKIWDHLEKIFRLDVDFHKKEFKKFRDGLNNNQTIRESFITYGETKINPVLNEMLRRDRNYPTWTNLLRFLFKEKLAETPEQLNYYKSGVWRTTLKATAGQLLFS
ncbi:hypothetical protein BH10BAC4_BH10BAC4_15130 [soil metagenome]